MTHFTFDYVLKAVTTEGEILRDEGQVSTSIDLGFESEREVFTEAVASTMHHFYTMQVEKEGRQLSEVTVTVKNFKY
jgi:hypothetical protein